MTDSSAAAGRKTSSPADAKPPSSPPPSSPRSPTRTRRSSVGVTPSPVNSASATKRTPRAPERARADEVVERTRPRDVRAVRRSPVVTVEVPDVIVPAPHLIAETRQSRNHERAVEHARHRGGVFERVDLSSARVEVRADGRAPRNVGHDTRSVKREIPRRRMRRTVGFVRRRVPKPHLRETKPLRVSRASVERVRGVRGDGTRAGIASSTRCTNATWPGLNNATGNVPSANVDPSVRPFAINTRSGNTRRSPSSRDAPALSSRSSRASSPGQRPSRRVMALNTCWSLVNEAYRPSRARSDARPTTPRTHVRPSCV